MSLRFKLYLFFIGLLLALGLSLITTAHVSVKSIGSEIKSSTEENVYKIVKQQLSASIGEYSERVGQKINSAFATPTRLKAIIESSMAAADESFSRKDIKNILAATFKSDTLSSALYALFEPNGYDNEDIYFTGNYDHSSDTGTLELPFYRDENGDVNFHPIDDPSFKYDATLDEYGNRAAEWYLCSKDTVAPCLTEPYLYELKEGYSELMTSAVMPVVKNNQFVGVVGSDINLSTLQDMITQVAGSLFEGKAKITLLSSKGIIVAASHYKDKIARHFKEAKEQYTEKLLSLHNNDQYFDDGKTLFFSQKITIKTSNTQWSMLVELPQHIAMQSAIEMDRFIDEEIALSAMQQFIVGGVILVLSILLIMALIRSVVRPLDNIQQRMDGLSKADGDLTQRLEIHTHAELIRLSEGFNAFLSRLRGMVNDLKSVGLQVDKQSEDVSNISKETEEQSLKQNQDIESVVAAMNEMAVSASEVANIAKEASQNAMDANDGIDTTQKTLDMAVQGVNDLAGDMRQASDAITNVAQRSEEINQILEVIRGIAEQTNLLALNAAIEAARAGEQGRGFAVVADEVRTLASKTRESTDEITSMIDALKSGVDGAVDIIQSGVNRASVAVEGTSNANQSLAGVVDKIKGISSGIDMVATAASEQSTVSEEINQNLTHIGDTAKELQLLAHKTRDNGETLSKQVQILDRELGQLRT